MLYEVVQGLLLDVFIIARVRLESFQVRLPGILDAERSTAQTESLIPDNISPLSALAFPSSLPLFPFSCSSTLASPKPFSSLTFLINNDCRGEQLARWQNGGQLMTKRCAQCQVVVPPAWL